jgi:hypothetical protein
MQLPARRHLVRALALAALLAGVAGLRVAAVHQTAFNWDELVLFDRVVRSAEDGRLRTGGHGGLSELALWRLVVGCSDEVATGRAARGVWLVLTLLYLAGIGTLLAQLLRGRTGRLHDAALGVALLGLLPVFLEWSIQVRTDHVALAAGVWGGVLLVASQRRRLLALAAGVCFGIGWCSSQKLAYVAALMALLELGRMALAREWRPRRDALRVALVMGGLWGTALLWQAWLGAHFSGLPGHAGTPGLSSHQVGRYLDIFDFYRNTIGYSQYAELLPTLVPHLALLVAMLAASAFGCRERAVDGRLLLGWAVLALGLVVGAFHAAAFAYFWMTLGLFVAVGLATALGPIRERLSAWRPGWVLPAGLLLWGALAIPAAIQQASMLRDSQGVQRQSLEFVRRNFAPDAAGFHPESGLFCGEPQRLGVWLSQGIYQTFGMERDEAAERRLMEAFRSEPVHYLVESFRLRQFPPDVRRFWATNYQPYRASVFVAGRRLAGARGDTSDFEVVVPGRYRWLPFSGREAVRIDDRVVDPGGTVELGPAPHTARFVEDVPGGVLVLALNDPPADAPRAFYKSY